MHIGNSIQTEQDIFMHVRCMCVCVQEQLKKKSLEFERKQGEGA